MTKNTVPHWIDGKRDPGTSDRSAPVYDPALGKETKRVVLANQADIDKAISSANAAFPEWRDLSLARRQSILFSFRELLKSLVI